MTVTINGGETVVPGGTTVAELVAARTAGSRGVAVALNGEVVPRSAWDATPLAPGDAMELLTATAGG
ncbi:MAG: sulfur carrier protein ThiS [Actinomycetota bacterium]|nr:sulfur carrier protein ThiS [Actinomycetota bacterium]